MKWREQAIAQVCAVCSPSASALSVGHRHYRCFGETQHLRHSEKCRDPSLGVARERLRCLRMTAGRVGLWFPAGPESSFRTTQGLRPGLFYAAPAGLDYGCFHGFGFERDSRLIVSVLRAGANVRAGAVRSFDSVADSLCESATALRMTGLVRRIGFPMFAVRVG